MLQGIRLLRQVGQFEAVDAGQHPPLEKLTLIYAENARGKTTLAAIFRSLATGDARPIEERRRLETMTAESDGGHAIAAVHLNFKAKVPGTDQATFSDLAAKAKAGCPVSKLFKTNITLDASLIA